MAYEIPHSEDELIHMQQEAIRRVREMQQRARQTLEEAGMPLAPDGAAPAPPSPPAAPPPPPENRRPSSPLAGLLPALTQAASQQAEAGPPHSRPHGGGLLPGLNISLDREQILLLVLLYMIYQDKGDHMLMLAIAYILL